MEIADITLALGGDKGNTVQKRKVTAAEIALLRAVHGDEAVFDIEPKGSIGRTSRAERARLADIYRNARVDTESGQLPAVNALFPGAAARVFESLAELEIPEPFFQAVSRVAPAPVVPTVSEPIETTTFGELAPAEERASEDEIAGDGIEEMNDEFSEPANEEQSGLFS